MDWPAFAFAILMVGGTYLFYTLTRGMPCPYCGKWISAFRSPLNHYKSQKSKNKDPLYLFRPENDK